MPVPFIPNGYHTITPYLLVADARAQLRFLKTVFDAQLHLVMPPNADRDDSPAPIMHAEVQIGTSKIMLGQAHGEWSPMSAGNHVYLPDVDVTYAKALAAGATSVYAPRDEFYGDRAAGVRDPQGNTWWLATHTEDVSPEEITRRVAAMKPPA